MLESPLIRKDSYNYEDSIRQADKALYTAKHKGKGYLLLLGRVRKIGIDGEKRYML